MHSSTRTSGRIAIVGPVVPFRGGIAHHTSRLAAALAEQVPIHVFSFSRLYPSWLYPGQFQIDQQKLVSGETPQFMLDSLNPLSWRRTVSALLEFKPDTVVIPWWTFFLAPLTRYISRRLAKKGIPVVFLCHNVVDHESQWWKAALSKWALRDGSAYVTHSPRDAERLQVLLPGRDAQWIPHPRYDRFPAPGTPMPRRSKLEMLYFGFIRPYKGLDVLLDALTRLDGIDFHLSIVGEPWGQRERYWQRRIDETGVGEQIEFVPRYVTDAEIPQYFQRADVILLPYREATGTGVAAIALHYRRPIIGSEVGGIAEMVQDGKTGFLIPPNDPEALARTITRFAVSGIPQFETNMERWVQQFEWGALADLVLKLGSNEHD